ncbi:MAG: cyclase family protein [Bacteroidetes bacterium]|nr:MAG: cyclase family protein [Bacteroidota bacterium]
MKISVHIDGQHYAVGQQPIDLAIPLDFHGRQANLYGAPAAKALTFKSNGFTGDVRQGGSCNVETYTLTPHCNGTHTECVGHLAAERLSVHHSLQDSLLPACLISISPQVAASTPDTYLPPFDADDHIISREALQAALQQVPAAFCQALVIRTLPNPPEKRFWDYGSHKPPFFSLEAMRFIRQKKVQHLLLDLPSVDRLYDEGRLSAHRLFWGMQPGATATPVAAAQARSITELIYVPNETPDGLYLLNLQIPAFTGDAAPSRPRLFRLKAQ